MWLSTSRAPLKATRTLLVPQTRQHSLSTGALLGLGDAAGWVLMGEKRDRSRAGAALQLLLSLLFLVTPKPAPQSKKCCAAQGRAAVSRGGGGGGWAELYLAVSACCSVPFRFGLTGAVPELSALLLSPAQQQLGVGHLLTQGCARQPQLSYPNRLHSFVCSTRGREGEQGVIQCGGSNH